MGHIYSEAKEVLIFLNEDNSSVDTCAVLSCFGWLEYRFLYEANMRAYMHCCVRLRTGEAQGWMATIRELHSSLKVSASKMLRFYGISERHLIAFRQLVQVLKENATSSSPKHAKEILESEAAPSKEDLIPPTHWFWKAIFKLMDYDWFSRVWTLPEALLAKESALLRRDGVLLAWDIIVTVRGLLWSNSELTDELWDKQLRRYGKRPQLRWNAAEDHLTMSGGLLSERGWRDNLGSLLLTIGNREASVAKDFIYTLLGLLNEKDRARIPVDYSLPDHLVFSQTVKVAVTNNRGFLLGLWTRYSHAPRGEGFPSWCPDICDARGDPDTSWPHPVMCFSREILVRYSPLLYVDCSLTSDSIGVRALRLDTIAE